MKVFAIKNNNSNNTILGYLIYYDIQKRFYIEISDNIDIKELPISLSVYLKNNKKTLNYIESFEWVSQRIVPSERQNIVSILNDLNITNYDEYTLLYLSKGRCSQDDCYLELISENDLPDYIYDRFSFLIESFIHLKDSIILVFFKNGFIKKCNLKNIVKEDRYKALLDDEKRYKDIKLEAGGYGINFANNLFIDSKLLYEEGFGIRMSFNELLVIMQNMIISTSEASKILDCSRQNINDLVKRGKLIPFKQTNKDTLFLKSDVLQRLDK